MAPKSLVIVESAGKIRKLKHILGADYNVMACMGHVTDLPRQTFGIDLDTMQPAYEIVKADVAKRLRAEAKKPYDTIYLAADPDREGEAIAYHVDNTLGICPQCGQPLVKRNGKHGPFIGCSGYPKCRHTQPAPTSP